MTDCLNCGKLRPLNFQGYCSECVSFALNNKVKIIENEIKEDKIKKEEKNKNKNVNIFGKQVLG